MTPRSSRPSGNPYDDAARQHWTHRRRSGLIPRRRWPRRILIAVNIVVAGILISSGTVYAYVKYRIDSIRTVAAPHLTPTKKGAKDSADGLPPENILLIGNETRAGLNPSEIQAMGSPALLSGSLSDVIMILHVDPAKRTASILSIPRDLFLPMPAGTPSGPYEKIDAALNEGSNGPDNLIQAITADLGIPINHYVELDFDGFENTVNAIGGINVDFPEPVFDSYSGLNISTPGCQHLDGSQALAMVRARHLQYDPPGNTAPYYDWPYDPESDLSRIVRDHTFLRILGATAEAKGISNPLTLNAFIGSVINQITIDPGLKNQLISLGTRFSNLNPSAIPEVTLPITTVGGAYGYDYAGSAIGDVDFPDQPADNQVIAAWDNDALPTPVAPTAVNVYNQTGTYDLAANTATALAADGLKIAATGDASDPASLSETWIEYPTNGLAQAMAVADHLDGATMFDPDPSLPAGTIDIDVGTTVSVLPPPSPPSTTPSTSGSAPSTAAAGAATSTTVSVPTPDGVAPSSSADVQQPWDPMPCPAK